MFYLTQEHFESVVGECVACEEQKRMKKRTRHSHKAHDVVTVININCQQISFQITEKRAESTE